MSKAAPGKCKSCDTEHPPIKKASQAVARCVCRGKIQFPNRERTSVRATVAGLIVEMFMAQFAPKVKSGEKLQTCRPTPKRMLKIGQRISLRQWTGKPYRSKQRILRESVITDVQTIWFNGVTIILGDVMCGRVLVSDDAQAFARADGFENLNAMATWFKAHHDPKIPFVGIVIYWSK